MVIDEPNEPDRMDVDQTTDIEIIDLDTLDDDGIKLSAPPPIQKVVHPEVIDLDEIDNDVS